MSLLLSFCWSRKKVTKKEDLAPQSCLKEKLEKIRPRMNDIRVVDARSETHRVFLSVRAGWIFSVVKAQDKGAEAWKRIFLKV
jgi:hypothetical protein